MRPWKSLCVECGPNVPLDQDGCCGSCGSAALGTWLFANEKLVPSLVAAVKIAFDALIEGAELHEDDCQEDDTCSCDLPSALQMVLDMAEPR